MWHLLKPFQTPLMAFCVKVITDDGGDDGNGDGGDDVNGDGGDVLYMMLSVSVTKK